MRVKNSIRNIYINILTQIIITILGFVSRKVFIDNLGAEYLGVNGLLTNVLSMLSLVEGGIGTSIVYNLYKPLAENDEEKIIALVQLYKKIYGVLAVIIFILSLTLYPFLGTFMKENPNVKFMSIIYFIFVAKNMISYLNAHKWSLINADQKGYILAKYNLIFNIITTITKIIILKITKNYIFFLLVEVGIFLIQNIWNGRIVNSRYKYIKTNKKYYVNNLIKENLVMNVKALFLHNIGSYCVFGTDNILISSFISVKAVGMYSNYTMIISQLSSLLTPILRGMGASVGNLIATESKNKNYEIFKIMYLINFWIYGFCVIFLYILLEPFISWWLGDGLLLNRSVLIVILINFYITGLRSSISIFKEKAGIFAQDKYAPLVEAVINLVTSIILVKWLGLVGIFLGTTISTIFVPLWIQAKLVYNEVFSKSVLEYFKRYCIYLSYVLIAAIPTIIMCKFIKIKYMFLELVLKGVICVIISNLIFVILVRNTEEFKYLKDIGSGVLRKAKAKFIRIVNVE